MKLVSYWHDTAPRFQGCETGPVEGDYDVAVVGGGFTGLSAAIALARKGASVVLLEADRLGGCASGRNGGMCNNGFAQDYAGMVGKLGAETSLRLYQSFNTAVDTVETLIRAENIDCDFQRVGKLKMAAKPAHYDKLARSHELMVQGADPDARLVSRAELGTEVGTDRYFGGLIFPHAAQMHMGKYVHGLATAAARHGAHLHESSPVTGIRRLNGQAHRLTTPRGSVNARQVLLATGTSAVGPLSWFRRRIVPVGAFLIVTEPLSREQLDALVPGRRNATDTRNFVSYFRVTPDNRLLFGGRARFAGSNARSDVKSGAILRRSMVEIFPDLADTRIDYCWGGMVDMTADRLPRAGEREGLFYSMGYSGHGTQMATYMGQIMAEVMDGNTTANPWGDFDWPAIPGHFGPTWFLPFVGAYYKLQDYLH
ncbi:FAD-binding oxidoreductase [Sulfitobacter sp. G21635-S1]|uniref:NAD(P)/FAD-dependent oxidoreductase n=1 Tax=Sulfitobacter sp. G21635-S1 TaxID=3014043 RepID=UPI0022AF0CF6|nr:FAD-binding oxidoreductase [Sulfitobacter sp. G21635-S1]MCZ4254142.1 FAD-binding oxidoreductase [Sulfitobacter sp. G21635-S1]